MTRCHSHTTHARAVGRFAILFGLCNMLYIAGIAPVYAQGEITPSPAPLTLTITGVVALGTPDLILPPNLKITLNQLRPDRTSPAGRMTTTQFEAALTPERTFRFENVQAQPGDYVFASAEADGIQQSSVIVALTPGQSDFELPLTLYSVTSNPNGLVLVRAQYLLDFQGARMQVLATYEFRMTEAQFFLSDLAVEGKRTSVGMPLPVGAVGIAPEVPNRFVVSGEAFAPVVLDTRPVRPNEPHLVTFSYQVPFEGSALIDQDYPYATEQVKILIPDNVGIRLANGEARRESAVAAQNTMRAVQFSTSLNTTLNPQRSYTEYQLQGGLASRERLIFTLEKTAANSTTNRPAQDADGPSAVALITFLVALLAAVALVALGARRMVSRPRS